MPTLAQYVKVHAIAAAKTRPRMWPALQRLRGKTRGAFCTPGVDLCIEGFESSANTYTFEVFRHLKKDLKMGHHTHSVAGVKLALRYEIPTLILFRPPGEAIPSLVSRFRPGFLEALLNYVNFYTFVARVADRVTLASFEEATGDIGRVVNRVASRTTLALGPYDATDIETAEAEAVRYIQAWTKEHGRPDAMSLPSEERARQKQALRSELERLGKYREAERTYERIRALHGASQKHHS